MKAQFAEASRAVLMIAATMPAHAQQTPAPQAADAEPEDTLADIVVTVNRRPNRNPL
jgi:hypothetical protein